MAPDRRDAQPLVTLVQARMTSSRLPGKVLRPLGDRTVLDHVVERCARFSDQVVVCTSTDRSDDVIESHCRGRGFPCSRGPLDDVFLRFRETLLREDVIDTEWFARATADCPLVSELLARLLIDTTQSEPHLDYAAVTAELVPRGLSVELVRRDTFLSIDPDGLDGPQREHVTLRLYERPGEFRCWFAVPPSALRHPEFRLTLDYPEDYELLARLLERNEALTAEAAVQRLLNEPGLAEINRGCRQKPARPQG